MTGEQHIRHFSEYMGDPKILEDGASYVERNYFWESADIIGSVFKPNDDIWNEMCDE